MKTYEITIEDDYGQTVIFEEAKNELEAYCKAISNYEFTGFEEIFVEELK